MYTMVFRTLKLIILMLVLGSQEGLSNIAPFRKLIVNMHNNYRRAEKAANMKLMEWNRSLEQEAAQWAQECFFDHQLGGHGENLYFNTQRKPNAFLIRQGLRAWYKEKQRYRYTVDCKNSCHYTQIVWHNSSEIGCAFSRCPELLTLSKSYRNAWYLVCFYEPQGNLVGQYPFSYGRPCSRCERGAFCRNKLCYDTERHRHQKPGGVSWGQKTTVPPVMYGSVAAWGTEPTRITKSTASITPPTTTPPPGEIPENMRPPESPKVKMAESPSPKFEVSEIKAPSFEIKNIPLLPDVAPPPPPPPNDPKPSVPLPPPNQPPTPPSNTQSAAPQPVAPQTAAAPSRHPPPTPLYVPGVSPVQAGGNAGYMSNTELTASSSTHRSNNDLPDHLQQQNTGRGQSQVSEQLQGQPLANTGNTLVVTNGVQEHQYKAPAARTNTGFHQNQNPVPMTSNAQLPTVNHVNKASRTHTAVAHQPQTLTQANANIPQSPPNPVQGNSLIRSPGLFVPVNQNNQAQNNPQPQPSSSIQNSPRGSQLQSTHLQPAKVMQNINPQPSAFPQQAPQSVSTRTSQPVQQAQTRVHLPVQAPVQTPVQYNNPGLSSSSQQQSVQHSSPLHSQSNSNSQAQGSYRPVQSQPVAKPHPVQPQPVPQTNIKHVQQQASPTYRPNQHNQPVQSPVPQNSGSIPVLRNQATSNYPQHQPAVQHTSNQQNYPDQTQSQTHTQYSQTYPSSNQSPNSAGPQSYLGHGQGGRNQVEVATDVGYQGHFAQPHRPQSQGTMVQHQGNGGGQGITPGHSGYRPAYQQNQQSIGHRPGSQQHIGQAQSVTPVSTQPCVDKDVNCAHWSVYCTTNNYVTSNCLSTCGRCGDRSGGQHSSSVSHFPVADLPDGVVFHAGAAAALRALCKDKDPRCPQWGMYCSFGEHIEEQCPKTCRVCW